MRISKLVLLLGFEQILMEKITFKVRGGEIRFATLYLVSFEIVILHTLYLGLCCHYDGDGGQVSQPRHCLMQS